jgi:hypothetical protein
MARCYFFVLSFELSVICMITKGAAWRMGISGNGYCSHTEYQHQNYISVKVNHHDLVLQLMLFLVGPLIHAYIAHDMAELMYIPHIRYPRASALRKMLSGSLNRRNRFNQLHWAHRSAHQQLKISVGHFVTWTNLNWQRRNAHCKPRFL